MNWRDIPTSELIAQKGISIQFPAKLHEKVKYTFKGKTIIADFKPEKAHKVILEHFGIDIHKIEIKK